jgi:signal transduction histidine kinase
MTVKAREIAAGDYSIRLPLSGWEEFRYLAASFNELTAKVEANIDEIELQNSVLQQASERQAAFNSNIAHELRTPLAGIYGNAEVISRVVDNIDDARKLSGLIQSDAERMKKICENLLLLAKMENNEVAHLLDKQEIDLTSLLAAIVAEKTEQYKEKRQKIECRVAENIFIYADEGLLRQVVENLLDNALKYSPAGAAVEIAASQSSDRAIIAVKDNGPGIPAEALPKIFDRFFRAEKSRARKIGGAGLGLSLTKQIVEVLGGKITVTSVEGSGSEFVVTLPVK